MSRNSCDKELWDHCLITGIYRGAANLIGKKSATQTLSKYSSNHSTIWVTVMQILFFTEIIKQKRD